MRTLIGLLCLASAAFPQGLSREDRNRAMSELHATRKQFLDAVAALSKAQWHFKPSETAWSVAETAEHIAASENFLFEIVTGKILSTPAAPEKKADTSGLREGDEKILTGVRDRSRKANAPKELVPKGRWPSPQAVVDHFRQSRDRVIAFVDTTPADLRAHFNPDPGRGSMDAYQWILMISAHSARHVAQIEEVKAGPSFPAR